MDVSDYKQFMKTDSFPQFDVQYYTPDMRADYIYGARAEYDLNTRAHTLLLPERYEVSRFLLFHELTHILDMELLATGERNHDYCLTGYMEYHASQVELMVIMGAESVKDKISFSLQNHVVKSEWTIEQYLKNKLDTALRLITACNQQTRKDGLDAFFNFLGLKSVCVMFSTDYEDRHSYRQIADRIPSHLLMELKRTFSGWIVDIDKAVAIYSHAVHAIL